MEAEMRLPRSAARRRLSVSFAKYQAVFRVSVASNLAYSLAILFRALNMGVMVFVLSQVWRTTFAWRGMSGVSGYQAGDLIWYLIATEVLAMSLPPIGRTVDLEVRSGQLAYMLGRPCSYILYHFSSYIGERIVRIGVNVLVGCVLGLIMAGPPHFSLLSLFAFVPVAFLAISIDFSCYFLIGLLAFWTEETQAFTFIFSRLVLVLGGVIAPLDIFPQPWRNIALALPFSAMLYGPARTFMHFEWGSFLRLLIQQGLTLLVAGLLLGIVYRLALRRVNINGG